MGRGTGRRDELSLPPPAASLHLLSVQVLNTLPAFLGGCRQDFPSITSLRHPP